MTLATPTSADGSPFVPSKFAGICAILGGAGIAVLAIGLQLGGYHNIPEESLTTRQEAMNFGAHAVVALLMATALALSYARFQGRFARIVAALAVLANAAMGVGFLVGLAMPKSELVAGLTGGGFAGAFLFTTVLGIAVWRSAWVARHSAILLLLAVPGLAIVIVGQAAGVDVPLAVAETFLGVGYVLLGMDIAKPRSAAS